MNTYMLNRKGIPKGGVINIGYQDVIGKREFINDILLNTIMPSFWFENMSLKEGQDATETKVVFIDIKGSFSIQKFVDYIRNYYEALVNRATKENGVLLFNKKRSSKGNVDIIVGVEGRSNLETDFDNEDAQVSEKDYRADKADFICYCIEHLYYFNVNSPEEFSAVARGLPQFLSENRDIALV